MAGAMGPTAEERHPSASAQMAQDSGAQREAAQSTRLRQ